MPQMSPLMWVPIFFTLMFFFYTAFPSLPFLKKHSSNKNLLIKKENSMKW